MARKMTTKEFIEAAKKVHGEKYDYSEVKYQGIKQNVWIDCPKHGRFLQRADIHLRGLGCPQCGLEKKNAKYTTEWFIEKAREIHGDKYDYSEAEYAGNKNKVKIICPKHGEFLQVAGDHLKGNGCPQCGRALSMTPREFLRKAVLKHGDDYDYSETEYTGNKNKVKIICPKHGAFFQRADCHLAGQGCPQCAIEDKGQRLIGKHRRPSTKPRQLRETLPQKSPVKYNTEEYERLKLKLHRKLKKGYKGEIKTNLEMKYGTIDLYFPEHKLGVMITSSYQGSESYFYNCDQTVPLSVYRTGKAALFEECNRENIFLYNFYEDEVRAKFDLIVSMIRNKIGLGNGYREYARKCQIVRIDKESAYEFYDQNHLQGKVTGKVHYGLCNPEDELVSVMSFNHIVSNRGKKASNKEWELIRFASYGSIVGGASKLLKHFLKKHPQCKTIVSYSDNRISNGALYKTLGFSLEHDVLPNYYYIENGGEDGQRYSKQKFKRCNEERMWPDFKAELTEVENAVHHGFYRLWDAGKKKWILRIK